MGGIVTLAQRSEMELRMSVSGRKRGGSMRLALWCAAQSVVHSHSLLEGFA